MGGLGKTSLIGHWLKQGRGIQTRTVTGLFYWSFYSERDLDKFVERFLEFAVVEMHVAVPSSEALPFDVALTILRAMPVLLVLDGLELLQELPHAASYGEFLRDELRELLVGAARSPCAGLVMLTSQFPFTDLTPYLGDSFRALDLENLDPEEGAALLGACNVGGSEVERQIVSRRLNGYPLGLRIFAMTLDKMAKGDPSRLVEKVFDEAGLSEIRST